MDNIIGRMRQVMAAAAHFCSVGFSALIKTACLQDETVKGTLALQMVGAAQMLNLRK